MNNYTNNTQFGNEGSTQAQGNSSNYPGNRNYSSDRTTMQDNQNNKKKSVKRYIIAAVLVCFIACGIVYAVSVGNRGNTIIDETTLVDYEGIVVKALDYSVQDYGVDIINISIENN